MVPLSVEVLQHICELAAESVHKHTHYDHHHAMEATDSMNIHFMSLLGFSQASQTCRKASAPYLFRRLRVRTIEQVLMIIGSSVAQHARHIHFPAVDMFTCRRPIPWSVLQLVSQATSICISANNPKFFYTARTPLSSLLHSAKSLLTLELYCQRITYGLDTLALIGNNLIPTCPNSLKALYITMPGGQPDYTGVDKLLAALSPSYTGLNHPLSKLEFIHLSVHLSRQVASCPSQLALGIAQRLPALRHISLAAPPSRQVEQKLSLFELVEARGEPQEGGHSERKATSWRVLRDVRTDDVGVNSQSRSAIQLEEFE